MDVELLRLLRTRGHWPPLERAVKLYARAGESGLVWLAIAALGFVVDRRRRPLYVRAMRVVVLTLFLNFVVKQVVRRARPGLGDELPPLVTTTSDRSYPSAHAATSFAGAGALARALPPGPLYLGAAAMALTRPYLGVHYPSDIAAGALLGRALERLL